MPGKSQQGGRGKQDSSKERVNSASQSETVRKPTIWPEWTEAELAAEKWDLGGGKGRAKSSANNVLFEDTEGVLLPPSLLASGNVVWKRTSNPAVLSTLGDENPPVIVLNPECDELDLISSNTHLMHSEFMCWMLSQLSTLWQNRHILAVETPAGEGGGDSESAVAWRPWEHIQPHPKGTPAPQFNPSGKYCVRLYWMGCWRKVTVDDFLPFLEQSASVTDGDVDAATASQGDGGGDTTSTQISYVPLYPRTGHPAELWPALLTKAVLKIAALDYSGGSEMSELGDCSIIHMFTGWTPLVKSIKTGTVDEVWESMADVMPMWKRDNPQATEEQRKQRKCIVLAGFTSTLNKSGTKPISPSQTQIISTSEATLKQAELLSSDYNLYTHPSYPIPLCQVRDEPLVLPPAEPPLPTLQAPYYLGLKHRARAPGEPTPPPTPPPVEPRWVELVAPFSLCEEEPVELAGSLSGETENDVPASEEKPGSDRGSEHVLECRKEKELKRVWMDYLDFVKAFQTLYIFDCSNDFKHRESYADLSQTVESSAQTATSAQPSKKTASVSQLASASKAPTTSKPQNLLFVDSPNPVTLHFVLASFSNWREGQRNTHTTTTTQRRSPNPAIAQSHPPPPPSSRPNSSAEPPQNGNNSGGEQASVAEQEYVIAGSLIVEEYSWKSIQSGKFVLRLTTTGTKGISITLPPGRHVFKLHVRAPIGHHIEVFSHTPFVLTDQDGIFTQLNKETSLYLSHGSNLVRTLLSIASELSNGEQTLEESLQPLVDFYSQFTISKDCITLLLASTVQAWAKQSAQYGLSTKMQFAWKAFLYKAFDFLQQQATDSSMLNISPSVLELRRQLQASDGVSEEKTTTIPDSWANREATMEEEQAAKVVQRSLRHHLSRCREQSMVAGSESYQQTLQELQQSIPLLEPSVEELGAIVLRGWFKLDPSLLDTFPFCQDEKSRAFSSVYTGTVSLLPPNTWTVVLREVFHVKESQIVVPQFECPISTHLLRVIDNDTNTEVPRIFHTTPPCVYHPNSRGYTFQAEAWNNSSEGMLTEGGKWNLRIVSSSPDLPRMEGEATTEEMMTTFYSKEIIDYCLPDRDGCIFRYFLKAAQDCSVSVQLCTSKQDAICKLEIMDNEITKVETRGRGNCILPLYLLEANQESEEVTGDVPAVAHKYVVRATILRDSWPLSESAWPYISMIKSVEKLEERPSSKPGSARRGKKEKGAGGKKGTTPQQSSSSFSPVTDKPHWTLRIVTKSSDKENLEIKKDTKRADALKGMVQAWEVEQPGRSKKAQESRQKYLDAHAIKESAPSTEEDQSIALSVLSEGSTAVPHPNTGPVKITQMDLSPFTIKHEGPAKLFDESEERARLQERQKLFKDYRTKRQAVMQVRNADREQRNLAKIKQLEQAEQWQADLDKLRNKLNVGREAIREKHLAKERARQEAEQAALKAHEEQQAIAGRDSKMTKGAKGKGKKK